MESVAGAWGYEVDSVEFVRELRSIDFSKAVRDLGHDPKVTPEEGIKRTVEWMKKEYKLGD